MPKAPRNPSRYTRLLRTHVTSDQLARLRALAAAHDLSVSAVVRQAIVRVLATPQDRDALGVMAALSALVAAEHTRLLLESTLAEGGRRSIELQPAALAAAERRLYEAQATTELSP